MFGLIYIIFSHGIIVFSMGFLSNMQHLVHRGRALFRPFGLYKSELHHCPGNYHGKPTALSCFYHRTYMLGQTVRPSYVERCEKYFRNQSHLCFHLQLRVLEMSLALTSAFNSQTVQFLFLQIEVSW